VKSRVDHFGRGRLSWLVVRRRAPSCRPDGGSDQSRTSFTRPPDESVRLRNAGENGLCAARHAPEQGRRFRAVVCRRPCRAESLLLAT
jgi:hypothetical protein